MISICSFRSSIVLVFQNDFCRIFSTFRDAFRIFKNHDHGYKNEEGINKRKSFPVRTPTYVSVSI